jgi:hypothetical protein
MLRSQGLFPGPIPAGRKNERKKKVVIVNSDKNCRRDSGFPVDGSGGLVVGVTILGFLIRS